MIGHDRDVAQQERVREWLRDWRDALNGGLTRRCCMNTLWGWGGLARTSPNAVLPVAPAAGGGPLNGRLAGSYRPNIP